MMTIVMRSNLQQVNRSVEDEDIANSDVVEMRWWVHRH
jgi:hypothetical protein